MQLGQTWERLRATWPIISSWTLLQDDADCPPNIQLFRRQDFCSSCLPQESGTVCSQT